MTTPYDDEFFDEITAEATASATVVAGRLIELIRPTSVVDVGCGRGAWLTAFVGAGVDDVVGIDGDYHDAELRLLRDDQFIAADLVSPPALSRSFDLAMCLEVIEHLDAAAGDRLIAYLTSLAPVIVFSAAVPGQGGVHHVNEQWPGYWHERFTARGWRALDVLRAPLWSDDSVSFWYAQNLLIYVDDSQSIPATLAAADALPPDAHGSPLALVHPELLRRTAGLARGPRPPASLRSLLRALPPATSDAARRVIADRRSPPMTTLRDARTRLGHFIRTRVLDRPVRPAFPDHSWVRTDGSADTGDDRRAADHIVLYAVIGTWLEGDVIEATVRNAFAQGCTRVLLVDNDSPDDTVDRAVAAGAELARTFITDDYDEARRMTLLHDVVAEVSVASGYEHVWWLWIDADEFPHGPNGMTIAEHLVALDRSVRVVGARMFDHYPGAGPANIVGRHPLDVQPLCVETPWFMCDRGHRKHPLIRWDRDGAPIVVGAGFHVVSSTEHPLTEAATPIFLHHFPFRERAVSLHRLDALVGGRARDDEAAWHLRSRRRSFDAVYRGKWSKVENLAMTGKAHGVRLLRWDQRVPAADAVVARWYGSDATTSVSQPTDP